MTGDAVLASVRRDLAARGVPCAAAWIAPREHFAGSEIVVRCDDSVTVHAATLDRYAAVRSVESCWNER